MIKMAEVGSGMHQRNSFLIEIKASPSPPFNEKHKRVETSRR